MGWLQDELRRFCDDRQKSEDEAAAKAERKPETIEAFTLHDFRKTAITAMQMAGVSEKEASVHVGCTPEVMRRHCERLDGMAIARRNAERLLGVSNCETIQMHATSRASDARASKPTLDDSANQPQTASA